MKLGMFLHFVPVNGVEYFPGICWRETYVFMFLCFQKTSLWTPSKTDKSKRRIVRFGGKVLTDEKSG